MAQAELLHSINQMLGLLSVHRLRATVLDRAEATIPRTGTAQDKESRRVLPEAFTNVRAFGFFADRSQ